MFLSLPSVVPFRSVPNRAPPMKKKTRKRQKEDLKIMDQREFVEWNSDSFW
jgi:hypothetical protein